MYEQYVYLCVTDCRIVPITIAQFIKTLWAYSPSIMHPCSRCWDYNGHFATRSRIGLYLKANLYQHKYYKNEFENIFSGTLPCFYNMSLRGHRFLRVSCHVAVNYYYYYYYYLPRLNKLWYILFRNFLNIGTLLSSVDWSILLYYIGRYIYY